MQNNDNNKKRLVPDRRDALIVEDFQVLNCNTKT